jgi:hypothetical protein
MNGMLRLLLSQKKKFSPSTGMNPVDKFGPDMTDDTAYLIMDGTA